MKERLLSFLKILIIIVIAIVGIPIRFIGIVLGFIYDTIADGFDYGKNEFLDDVDKFCE